MISPGLIIALTQIISKKKENNQPVIVNVFNGDNARVEVIEPKKDKKVIPSKISQLNK